MKNIKELQYKQTGRSTEVDEYGMREMQARAYECRDAQYLLIKSPPASGKSRALMFVALDKLYHQGIKKVIIAVPERSIGGSFRKTDLTSNGFFTDWNPSPEFNLCTPGAEKSKVQAFLNFFETDEKILICTHATLRYAFDQIDDEAFNDTLIAIDEFHHVSADKEVNKLGAVLHGVMQNSTAHIVAMTGSYFRGDAVPVLLPEDEDRFEKVSYTYYEQMNGYKYLKSLGIGYHFYQGRYTSAISEVLDTDKKTIIHIPNVNSGESTKDKYEEVGAIIDAIGEKVIINADTGILEVERRSDGKVIKIADLVNDNPSQRETVVEYLRTISSIDDIDIIIALGMAKEGFDWPYCEHALTIGYRGSLTEIIQIIGRCTRDSENKTHAQFTNLLAQPDAKDDEVQLSVNNLLKAITASLLMEQVLAPNFSFKARQDKDDNISQPGEIKIRGFKEPSTDRVRKIIETDLNDLKASILQDDKIARSMTGIVDPEVINKVMVPKIIETKYPDLSEKEIEEVRQHVVADSIVKSSEMKEVGDKKFLRMAGQFVDIENLHIDLIDKINPFQDAFEVLSKELNKKSWKAIQDAIEMTRIDMTSEEALMLWPSIKLFRKQYGKNPDIKSHDPKERRMAQAIIFINQERAKHNL